MAENLAAAEPFVAPKGDAVGTSPPEIVVRFTESVPTEHVGHLVEVLSDVTSSDVVVGGESFEPRVGSVVLTLGPDLIFDGEWLALLLDECAGGGGPVGIGVVDSNGKILHAGAAEVAGGFRPFGVGCEPEGSQLFQTDRRGSRLLAPFARLVDSPGQGASAMVESTIVGRFLGGIFATSRAVAKSTVELDGTIAAAIPNAVLVVGSTGDHERDLTIVERLGESTNPVWLAESAVAAPRSVSQRNAIFAFDAREWTGDALASAFAVSGVLHLDDCIIGDDDAAQQLLRARPGAGWAALVEACPPRFLGRVSRVVDEADVEIWAEQMLDGSIGPAPSPYIGTIPECETLSGTVSVVVPVHGCWEMTQRCLDSLRDATSADLELIVVDDASPDHTAERLAERGDVIVVTNEQNLGFPAAVNRGIARSSGEFVCVLNNDTESTPGWLDEMLAILAIEGTSMVGPRSNQIAGLQHVAGSPSLSDGPAAHQWAAEWVAQRHGQSWRTNRLIGFCLLTRRSTLVELGGFDESFGRGNFEDDELCDRMLSAGGDLRVADGAVVLHHGSATFAALNEDFTAILGSAARHRNNAPARRSGAITGIVLSDGNVETTQNTVWSMLGLTDHIRVVERCGPDTSRLHLARGSRLGVEVVGADWQSSSGADAAFADLASEHVVMLLSGEVLEVTDWGAARAEIESRSCDGAGINVGSHAEVRVIRLGTDGIGAFGSECDTALTAVRIRQRGAAPQPVPGPSVPEQDPSKEPETTLITAIVLSDGDRVASATTAASVSTVADAVIVLDSTAPQPHGPDNGTDPNEYPAQHVDWTDQDALAVALLSVSSAWLLVLEAGERVSVDPVGWAADLCCLPMEAVGLRVGDRVEVRLTPTGPGMIDLIGSDVDLVSEGLRIVPSALEHGDVIAKRFPELAAGSSIRAALARKPEWVERLSETMELDEQNRMLDQIRDERPGAWDIPADLVEVGAVIAFDPRASRCGEFEPNAYGRLRDTVSTALDQSHPLVELIVVVPASTDMPAFGDDRIRVVEHFGIDDGDPGHASLARLANLGSTLVSGQWICLLDVGDRLRFDHVEHLLAVAYTDRSEYVHGLVVSSDVASSSVEVASERQVREGSLGPGLFHGELRALELREGAWRIPEFASANRTARWRVIGVTESAAEAVTCARPVIAIHTEPAPTSDQEGVSQDGEITKPLMLKAQRLHLGCGPNVLQGWTNIDLDEQYSPDLVHDLSKGLPFDDDAIELIYSEHFFEHLTLDVGLGLLAECRRVLRPGGTLRIAMPDLAAVVDAYLTNWRDQAWVEDFPELTNAAHMLNFALREWGHQYVYDREDLTQRLRDLGFANVEPQGWGESRHEVLRNQETRPDSVLIVECTAP